MIERIKNYLQTLQNNLCNELEKEENNKFFFQEDKWKHASGGGGATRILEGEIFERAGVNFSYIKGSQLPYAASLARPELLGCNFEALGVSAVIHPRNPYIPSAHMNVRFFLAEKKGEMPVWWFGGGYDLTPYYGFMEDCQHWHQIAFEACRPFGESMYPKFKKWADEYFYLKHRQEARGIGGVFFDDLNDWNFETCFDFIKNMGNSFLLAYLPIVKRRKDMNYGKRQRQFQQYRRGRYVEFNLIYDRGTLFGLQSGGRTESILMSLPPEVVWRYNWQPKIGTEEAQLYELFLPVQDWI